MKKVFSLHIFPFLLALSIFFFFSKNNITTQQVKPIDYYLQKIKSGTLYYANYDDPDAEEIATLGINNGELVIIGSSEMTLKDFPSIPYNFFHCLGLGHAGNQCFSIFTQLCAMGKGISNSRLVIILSPGWFSYDYKGTSLESFLEFNNERFLYKAFFNPNLPDSFKRYTGDYICNNMEDIESPSAIIKTFNFNVQVNHGIKNKIEFYPFQKLYNEYCRLKANYLPGLKIAENLESNFKDFQKNYIDSNKNLIARTNWDSLYKIEIDSFAAHSNNNDMGIENVYYTKYIKTHHLTTISIVPLEQNQEFKDLKMLLSLLRYYHCNTYFIIQAFNPFAYANLKELEPTINAVRTELDKNHFSYFNMYVTDTNHYQKGTLKDIMHLGKLGWFRVDSAIFHHFYNKKQI